MYYHYLAQAVMSDRIREAAAIRRGQAGKAPRFRRTRTASPATLLGKAEAVAQFNRRYLNNF